VSKLLLSKEQATECGIGKGAECCAFLTMRPGGFACGRSEPALASMIRSRVAQMNAKRIPEKAFPECQKEGAS
jgi:hypothetical protein